MDSGKMDRRIDIQTPGVGYDDFGQPLDDNWQDVALGRAASYRPLRGTERNVAEQWVGKEQVEFQIRYSSLVSTLKTGDRVIYPAEVQGISPPEIITNGRIFDIIAIHEIGRRDGLKIIAARRSDT